MKEDKFKELREWLNLAFTVAGPLVIAWIVWSLNSRFTIERLQSDQKYVAQTSFDGYQAETNNRLDKLRESMSDIKQDVALIKQRVTTTKRPNEPIPND